MGVLTYFVGPLIGVIAASVIMKIMYKDAEKKDKGFVLNYHRLSDRRKFIRSLWGIPLVIVIFIGLYWMEILTPREYQIAGIVFILIMLVDVAYHYAKWKKSEEKDAQA